jgi:hypothetical protein
MNPKIPAIIALAAVTTEAVLDHEHAKPHVETAVLGQVVVALTPGPTPATSFDLTQIA